MTANAKITVSAEDKNTARVFAKVRGEIVGAGRSAEGLRDKLSLLAPALAGTLSLAGVAAFIKSSNDGLLKIKDLSEATGSAIEKISGLENVARNAGGGIDDVSGVLIKFNAALKEADGKNGVSRALEAIGLDAKALREQDPADALLDTAKALATYADDGNKARIVQDLFGKSIKDAAPFLNDLAEAGRLNATVTAQQVEQADRYNKQLAQFKTNAEDLARVLSSELTPGLSKTFAALAAGPKAFGGFTDFLLSGAKEALKGNSFSNAADGVAFYTGKLNELEAQRDKMAAQKDSFLYRDLDGEIAKLKQFVSYYRSAFSATAPDNGQSSPTELARRGRGRGLLNAPDLGGGSPAASPGAAAVQSAADRYIETLRQQLQGTQDLTLAETVLAEIRSGSLKGASAADQQRAQALATEIEGTKALIRAARDRSEQRNAEYEEINRVVEAQQRADTERVNAIIGATPSGQFKAVLADIELINKRFKDGTEQTELWAEAIRATTGRIQQTGEEVERLSTFAEQAGRNIQDQLGTTLQDVLTGNFANIGEQWRNLLIGMAAQAAAARLNDYLFGNSFGGKGDGAGVLGTVLKGFAGFYAEGGSLGAGQWGIAGEGGRPEVVSGPATITPLSKLGGGGDTQVNITNVINGDVSAGTVKLIESAMSRVKADILRSSRQGGAYAGAY